MRSFTMLSGLLDLVPRTSTGLGGLDNTSGVTRGRDAYTHRVLLKVAELDILALTSIEVAFTTHTLPPLLRLWLRICYLGGSSHTGEEAKTPSYPPERMVWDSTRLPSQI